MNKYLAINIEGKIGHPTVIRTSSFIMILVNKDNNNIVNIFYFPTSENLIHYPRTLIVYFNDDNGRFVNKLYSCVCGWGVWYLMPPFNNISAIWLFRWTILFKTSNYNQHSFYLNSDVLQIRRRKIPYTRFDFSTLSSNSPFLILFLDFIAA